MLLLLLRRRLRLTASVERAGRSRRSVAGWCHPSLRDCVFLFLEGVFFSHTTAVATATATCGSILEVAIGRRSPCRRRPRCSSLLFPGPTEPPLPELPDGRAAAITDSSPLPTLMTAG